MYYQDPKDYKQGKVLYFPLFVVLFDSTMQERHENSKGHFSIRKPFHLVALGGHVFFFILIAGMRLLKGRTF